MDFFEKVKGFLTEPSKTFDAVKGEDLGEAIKYYAVIAAIYSAIFALLLTFMGTLSGSMMGRNLGAIMGSMMGAGAGIAGAIVLFVFFLIFAIIGALVGGAILHIFVYIVGGRKGLVQTIKAVMYGSTPSALFGWIPIIGVIAAIWSLIVEILGISQLHELTTGKAILAIIIMLVILVPVLFFAFFAILAISMGSG